MDILEAADLAGHADGQTADDAPVHVALVHVLMGRGRGSLAEVHGFVVAVGIADYGKTAATDA